MIKDNNFIYYLLGMWFHTSQRQLPSLSYYIRLNYNTSRLNNYTHFECIVIKLERVIRTLYKLVILCSSVLHCKVSWVLIAMIGQEPS